MRAAGRRGLLDGRVAIVTGAARGIGRAVALAFAAEGARVWTCDVIEGELAEIAAPAIEVRRVDVSVAAEVARFADEVLATESRVDVLANIAGIISQVPIEATDDALWDRTIGVNLTGPFLMARAVVPAMKAARRGSIINMSSNAGVRGVAGEVAYSASKFGLEGMSRALAKELAPFGIAVNTVTPGAPVRTPMSETTYGAALRAVWREPADLAPAFVHLALQDAQGINDRWVRAWDLAQMLQQGAA